MNIKRSIRYWWQRRTRGFDDSETWSLDYSMAKWMLPRLKRYREIVDNDMTHAEICDEIIFAFEKEIETRCATYTLETEERERVDRGWEFFREHVRDLWW